MEKLNFSKIQYPRQVKEEKSNFNLGEYKSKITFDEMYKFYNFGNSRYQKLVTKWNTYEARASQSDTSDIESVMSQDEKDEIMALYEDWITNNKDKTTSLFKAEQDDFLKSAKRKNLRNFIFKTSAIKRIEEAREKAELTKKQEEELRKKAEEEERARIAAALEAEKAYQFNVTWENKPIRIIQKDTLKKTDWQKWQSDYIQNANIDNLESIFIGFGNFETTYARNFVGKIWLDFKSTNDNNIDFNIFMETILEKIKQTITSLQDNQNIETTTDTNNNKSAKNFNEVHTWKNRNVQIQNLQDIYNQIQIAYHCRLMDAGLI